MKTAKLALLLLSLLLMANSYAQTLAEAVFIVRKPKPTAYNIGLGADRMFDDSDAVFTVNKPKPIVKHSYYFVGHPENLMTKGATYAYLQQVNDTLFFSESKVNAQDQSNTKPYLKIHYTQNNDTIFAEITDSIGNTITRPFFINGKTVLQNAVSLLSFFPYGTTDPILSLSNMGDVTVTVNNISYNCIKLVGSTPYTTYSKRLKTDLPRYVKRMQKYKVTRFAKCYYYIRKSDYLPIKIDKQNTDYRFIGGTEPTDTTTLWQLYQIVN